MCPPRPNPERAVGNGLHAIYRALMAQQASSPTMRFAAGDPLRHPLSGELPMRSFRVLLQHLSPLPCAFAAPCVRHLARISPIRWNRTRRVGVRDPAAVRHAVRRSLRLRSDGKPVWYTAAVYFQPQSGRSLFSGDLYVASGPWFGAFFNPAAFTARRRDAAPTLAA
jgi:hypothetical protein